MRIRLIVIVAVGVLAALGQGAIASAQADPAALVRRFYDALNGGDTPAVMELFADDVVWQGTGPCAQAPCVGKTAVQQELQRLVADHDAVTVISSQVSGGSVSARIEVRGDFIRQQGLERIAGTDTTELRGDKIAAYRFVLDRTDPQSAAFVTFLQAQQGQRAPAQLPRTGDMASPLPGILALAAGLVGLGLALRRAAGRNSR